MKANNLLKMAIQASIEAGNAIMAIYTKDFDVAYKADASPLTEADEKANEILMRFLEPTGIPVISEENKQLPFETRKNWQQCWIVDPLDGTKEFIKKNGEFTVNVALIDKGKPILGVIYVPATGKLYFGDVHQGKSFKALWAVGTNLEDLLHTAIEIFPTPHNDLLRVVGSRSHMNEDTKTFIETLKEKTSKEIEILSKGSSLKICLVVEGKADIYPRFAPTMEWDIAAGHAICAATGLEIIDMETGKPMAYNRENLLNNHFLISNGQ